MARFLFPEDEPAIRELCGMVVAVTGHVLDLADDGLEACARVRATEYDAIVSDGMMPGLDGPSFLAEIQALVANRVPCALKSGLAVSELEEMGRPVGVQWFIEKSPSGGGSMLDHLVGAFTEMLRTRVDWLLALQPGAAQAPLANGRGVDLEALEQTVRHAAVSHGGLPVTRERRKVLHAPSPYAAVQWLAGSVHDWPSLLSPGEETTLKGVWERRGRPEVGLPLADEEVRLGDGQLRRMASRLPEPLRTRYHLALCCARYGWRWRVDADCEFVVDPPVEAHKLDGVYHCETGPAIRYRDGWSIYALHGVCVPPHVITAPERITIKEIRTERHAELRRVLRERYGEQRFLAETGAILLDVDTVPVDALVPLGRSITRALIVDEDSRRFLVASDGSTRRVYHMEVPVDCDTCQQAYAALSGRSDVRTIVQA